MKRFIALVFVSVLVLSLGLSGCMKKEYELPWDHFCYSADDGSVIELSPEEKGVIIDCLNNGEWYGEIAKCPSDVKFATQRQSIGYCMSEGVFNDFTQNKSLRLSEEDRAVINGYLANFFAKETAIKGIDGATKIEATRYDIGDVIGSVTLTDEADVKHIVDNLNSLKLKELKYHEPTAIAYELAFYGADGKIMKTIAIELGGWVEYHGSLHAVVSGELDVEYIKGLFEAASNKDACEHIWDDGIEVEGGTDAYLMEYTCTVCGEKEQYIITIIPPEPIVNLEFWIGENVDAVDFSAYQEKYGMFGGREYYGMGYLPTINESGEQVDPEHCVIYTVTSYPDYADKEQHVTHIYITDPNVSFYGISLNSSFEEFECSIKSLGFSITHANENSRTAEKGKYSVTITKEWIRIRVEVENRDGIVF